MVPLQNQKKHQENTVVDKEEIKRLDRKRCSLRQRFREQVRRGEDTSAVRTEYEAVCASLVAAGKERDDRWDLGWGSAHSNGSSSMGPVGSNKSKKRYIRDKKGKTQANPMEQVPGPITAIPLENPDFPIENCCFLASASPVEPSSQPPPVPSHEPPIPSTPDPDIFDPFSSKYVPPRAQSNGSKVTSSKSKSYNKKSKKTQSVQLEPSVPVQSPSRDENRTYIVSVAWTEEGRGTDENMLKTIDEYMKTVSGADIYNNSTNEMGFEVEHIIKYKYKTTKPAFNVMRASAQFIKDKMEDKSKDRIEIYGTALGPDC